MPLNNEHFSDILDRYEFAKEWFEMELSQHGFETFNGISSDTYDGSIEFYAVGDDERLSEDAQKFIQGEGFVRAYLNHNNGVETHYTWLFDDTNYSHWRVDRKRMLVSHLPESWNGHNHGYTEDKDL